MFGENTSKFGYLTTLNDAVSLCMFDIGRLLDLVNGSKKTKKRIADDAEISLQSLYNYIEGNREPGANVIPRLASALSTSVAFLYGETNDPSPDALKKKEELKNFQMSMGDASLADEDLMRIMEDELEAIKRIREQKERILANTRSRKDNTSGN